jgi:hypothetical protein
MEGEEEKGEGDDLERDNGVNIIKVHNMNIRKCHEILHLVQLLC